MNSRRARLIVMRLAIIAALLLFQASPAYACSVCFADTESPMAKGVVAGVFTLVGVVSFVLMSIAGTGIYWIQRGRRMARLEGGQFTGGSDAEGDL